MKYSLIVNTVKEVFDSSRLDFVYYMSDNDRHDINVKRELS